MENTSPKKRRKSPTHRFLLWVAINAVAASLAWLGVNGNIGAGRLFCFLNWAFTSLSLLMAAVPRSTTDDLRKVGMPVPGWMYKLFDLGMLSFLVWHGWWFSAVAVVINAISIAAIYYEKPVTQPSEAA